MTLGQTACQTYKLIELPDLLKNPCPTFNFKAGRLTPQVIKLKLSYEQCKMKHLAVVELIMSPQ